MVIARHEGVPVVEVVVVLSSVVGVIRGLRHNLRAGEYQVGPDMLLIRPQS